MKKKYITPELETVKYDVRCVILTSPLESSIPEIIGGDDEDDGVGGDPFTNF